MLFELIQAHRPICWENPIGKKLEPRAERIKFKGQILYIFVLNLF